jgi:hypothetical protein
MIETLILFWAAWKFELICAGLLVAFPFVRKRFSNNIIVAEFINQATNQIATAMEAREKDPDTDAPPDMKRSARKARRREVRAKLAKEARKANRSKK